MPPPDDQGAHPRPADHAHAMHKFPATFKDRAGPPLTQHLLHPAMLLLLLLLHLASPVVAAATAATQRQHHQRGLRRDPEAEGPRFLRDCINSHQPTQVLGTILEISQTHAKIL